MGAAPLGVVDAFMGFHVPVKRGLTNRETEHAGLCVAMCTKFGTHTLERQSDSSS